MAVFQDGAVREFVPFAQKPFLSSQFEEPVPKGPCLVRVCVMYVMRNFSRIRHSLQSLPTPLKWLLLNSLSEERILNDDHLRFLLDESFTSLRFDRNVGITSEGLVTVSRLCPRLSRLSIRGCPNITDKGLASIFAACPLMDHLDVGLGVGVLKNSGKKLRNNCRALSSLCLDGCTSVRERDLIDMIKASGGFLRNVSLAECSGFCTDKLLFAISQSCSQLNYLSVSNVTTATVVGIAAVTRHCKALEHLDLSETKLSAEDLRAIIFATHKLKSLNLSFITDMNDDVITVIANCCPTLEDLRIVGVQGWEGTTLVHLFQNCGTVLRRLFLDNSKDIKNEAFLALRNLCQGETLLDELDAEVAQLRRRANSDPPEQTVKFVPRHSPRKDFLLALETVSICGNRHVKDCGLATLLSLSPNLKSLNISGLPHATDDAARSICKFIRGPLREIDVSLCPGLTDEGVRMIAKTFGPSLNVVRLYGNQKLTNRSFSCLAENCRNLYYLSLYGCKSLTDEGAIPLIQSSCAPLQALDLSLTKITNITLEAIAASCPLLEVLRVNTCSTITGEGVAKVAQACPLLRYINANNCHVKDNHLSTLARSCKFLQTLSVSSNEDIGDAGFLLCARGLPRLQKFILSCASAVSGDAIRIAKNDRPNLEIVFV